MPKLSEFIAVVAQSRLLSSNVDAAAIAFEGISTDSRTLARDDLFIALQGPNFDGSRFLQVAKDKGASAAVVPRGAVAVNEAPLTCVEVPDTLIALQQWACHWRSLWPGTLIAVTGSNGKTTVKQMIAAVLCQALGEANAWATLGNLNNHIGVPLSVLGLKKRHRAAVLELGMNHPNEIARLAAIAAPHVALVNNAQREHQEFMKSVAAVALENGQVFAALPAHGIAVFPRDPEHEPLWRRLAGTRRCVRFGFSGSPCAPLFEGDDVEGQWADSAHSALELRLGSHGSIRLHLNGTGEHFAMNAMAAAACAWAAEIPLSAIEAALSRFEPVAGRGKKLPLRGGGILVDDTYNANPDSVRAAIDALVSLPAPRALVLGDMGEVGEKSEQFHCEVLRYADAKKIQAIWLHGNALAAAHQQTGLGKHFSELEGLLSGICGWLDASQRAGQRPSVWAKGSRFMKMERVVEQLKEPLEGVAA
jgi:UDP-N-acetylmuramoyl-tripeptide--D-alanyl-D-alanine ligase